MPRVLLLSPRAPVTLELARQMAAGGYEVMVADSLRFHLARGSRAVSASFRVPPPRQDPEAFIDALAEIARREGVEHVIPTCEEVFWLAHGRHLLAPLASVLCPSSDVLLALHDKHRFTTICAELGVPAPETTLLTSRAALEPLRAEPGTIVLKPVYSRFASRTLVRPRAAALAIVAPTPEEPWVAQRFVGGRQLSTYSVAHHGRVTLHAAYGAPWRAGRGASVYFAAERHAAAQQFVESIARRFAFTGQLSFDFIEDEGGRLWPIECNPRATSGLHLFPRDGAAASAIVGDRDPNLGPLEPPEGRRAMLLGALALYAPLAIRRPRDLWRLGSDVARASDVVFSWRDPLPALVQGLTSAELAWRALRHRTGVLAASTVDIEHNGPADVARLPPRLAPPSALPPSPSGVAGDHRADEEPLRAAG